MSKFVTEIQVGRPSFLGGESWGIKKLNRINVMLGRNGAGKSLLLRSIRDGNDASRHYVVPERTGDITFDANLLSVAVDSVQRRNRSSSNSSPNYRQEVITRIQGYYTKRGTKRAKDINHDPEDLIKSLNIILPDFRVNVKSESPFYSLERIQDGSIVTSVGSLSSGESQLLSLGLDIVTIVGIWEVDNQQERILLIDEPDAHIHPDLQIKFADFLIHISSNFNVQVIVATHSTTLMSALAHFGNEDVSLFYLERNKKEFFGEKVSNVNKEISSILGGHLVLGSLFGDPILLVEGDDDYRVWVQVVRGGKMKACVLPCNGDEIKNYQKTLEKMLAVLSENVSIRGFALIDGDKPLPQPNENNKQDFVKFLRLNCHETENLYLTDEVLCDLGYTWDEAKNKIKGESHNYGNKKDLLDQIESMDRQHSDFKKIINEIASILDQKDLNWSVRLGKFIGKERPTGMLESYIGLDLVNSLWK